MAHGRNQNAWLVAACAALVAQVAPQALCRSCDRPCCEPAAANVEAAPTVPESDPADHCPLCAAVADACPLESNSAPCRCRLDARQDEPKTSPQGNGPSFDEVVQASVPGVALPVPRRGLGVSREYLAASLAVPIRPPRILFGVWRN